MKWNGKKNIKLLIIVTSIITNPTFWCKQIEQPYCAFNFGNSTFCLGWSPIVLQGLLHGFPSSQKYGEHVLEATLLSTNSTCVLYVGVIVGCNLVHKLLASFKDANLVMPTILVSLVRRWLAIVDSPY
jgi:hypothetical protein